ncbi:LysR family transcriptional regulator [Embleya sp. NBC_00888]|uniref:LysR family transcriptional regulator n=1 Tax=Embleya sp. NBC_00888 TaxID=2975960 RepID=UPI00386D4AC9|nr:LysR family transcriptional regulator [Embleya sp. NBC_00888]
MDVRLLRALVAVADCGGFGVAAGRLSITQPALSKQIQALEAEVGGALFTRGRRGAEATRLGQALLPEARELVRRVDALSRRAAQFKRGEAGSLAVGFGLSGIDLAPQAVAAFRRRFPGVEITLEDMSSNAQVEAVRAGDLDVGFVRLPAPEDLGRLVVLADTLAVASPGDQDPPPTDPAGVAAWLRGRPVVRLTRAKGPGLVRQIELFEEEFGARPEPVQEASDLQTVLALVAAGVGAALVPAGAADIASATVTVTPIESEGGWGGGSAGERGTGSGGRSAEGSGGRTGGRARGGAGSGSTGRSDAVSWRIGAVWDPARATRVRDNFLAVVQELAGRRDELGRERDRGAADPESTWSAARRKTGRSPRRGG